MNSTREIVICLGSSCFSRGNKEIVHIIKSFLQENKLEEEVYFHGAHCYSNCDKGPVVKVDSTEYTKVDPEGIVKILKEEFKL
ncbi:MAG: (2Fe-2S) ferredoxin domain-containing protein [Bacteroidales bacterium]|nr:(2Fe-2S) ferredoxin domain-containing protein [Bacteroidales bacterium]